MYFKRLNLAWHFASLISWGWQILKHKYMTGYAWVGDKSNVRQPVVINCYTNIFSYYNYILGASCTAADLSMNSKCYKTFNSQRSWFSASNNCLENGGTLAVFTDTGRPSQNTDLTNWLVTDKTYWIGLVRDWWKNFDGGYVCNLTFIDNDLVL